MKRIYIVSTAKLCCCSETAAHPSPWQLCCSDLHIHLRLKVQLQSRSRFITAITAFPQWRVNSIEDDIKTLNMLKIMIVLKETRGNIRILYAQVFTLGKFPPQFNFTFSTVSCFLSTSLRRVPSSF